MSRAQLRRDYADFDKRNRQDVPGAQERLLLVHPAQLPMFDDLPEPAVVAVQCDLFNEV